MNICIKCKHLRTTEEPKGIWYNYFCGHPDMRRTQGIDPVTGAKCFFGKNDLGTVYSTDEDKPQARDINPIGECSLWEPKP